MEVAPALEIWTCQPTLHTRYSSQKFSKRNRCKGSAFRREGMRTLCEREDDLFISHKPDVHGLKAGGSNLLRFLLTYAPSNFRGTSYFVTFNDECSNYKKRKMLKKSDKLSAFKILLSYLKGSINAF